jgi:hypothetical protein
MVLVEWEGGGWPIRRGAPAGERGKVVVSGVSRRRRRR